VSEALLLRKSWKPSVRLACCGQVY
jgi:hypothetical protein